MPLTDKQLEKLGIIKDGGKLNPRRYWCNPAQIHMIILATTDVEHVISMIFDEGIRQGIEEGKKIRSKQMNNLLEDV
jgi:hypothetical protein